jgi:hypothetical protein
MFLFQMVLDDATVDAITGISSLKMLSLHSCKLPTRLLAKIVNIPSLRDVYLTAIPSISDESVVSLHPLRNLDSLHLEDMPLTDACCNDLSRLKHLQWLSIKGTRITDKGAAQLQALSNLTCLTAYETLITEEGKARLEQAIPGLDVTIGMEKGMSLVR